MGNKVLPKRFYKTVKIVDTDGGFGIELDGRRLKTPRKAELVLPTKAYGQNVAAEWEAQHEEVKLQSMAMNRLANSAIDLVAPRRSEIEAEILAYARGDVLCFWVEAPIELAQLQHQQWRPVLDWATDELGAALQVHMNVGDASQPDEAIVALGNCIRDLEPFALLGLHMLAARLGSIVLALAVIRGHLSAAKAYEVSRLEEIFQNQKWGTDHEAESRVRQIGDELDEVATFLSLI